MATVTQKGQVTIPKEVRDSLGILPGMEVEFVQRKDQWILQKKMDRTKLRQWFGSLSPESGLPSKTDNLIDALRGPAQP